MRYLLALAAMGMLLPAADGSNGVLTCLPAVYKTEVAASARVVHAEFMLENHGSKTVEVVEISPSCSCVTVIPFNTKLVAGGRVAVDVDVDLVGRDGPLAKEVILKIEGGLPQEVTLSILALRTGETRRDQDLGEDLDR